MTENIDTETQSYLIETPYKFQKKILFIIVAMLVVVWGILIYFWLQNIKIKARLEEREAIARTILIRNDSVSKFIIDQQATIIHQQDSVIYLLYLKNITHGK